MTSKHVIGTCAAVGVAALMHAGIQAQAGSPQQSPAAPAAPAAQERTAPAQTVTVTGCIQKESDYRKAADAGRGGVAGTGVGAGNEFMLVNASMARPTGTAATATAFELTGENEAKSAPFVGKRVEISGVIKAAEVGAANRPTGGDTAGRPPSGVDVGGQDLRLHELEITAIREVSGTCPTN